MNKSWKRPYPKQARMRNPKLSTAKRGSTLRRTCRVDARATSPDVAIVAVETIAAAALRARLRSHGKVAVTVRGSGWDLMAGRMEGAKVEGRRWESPLGLTARVLDVEVGRVDLDLPAVFTQQRIVLRNTPSGAARVVFNGDDFGTFLQHPLVTTAARTAVQGRSFLFDRAGVVIVPGAWSGSGSGGSAGCVLFSGTLPASGQRFQLTMRPTLSGRAVDVDATPVGAAAQLRSSPGPRAAPLQRQPQEQGASGTTTAPSVASADGPTWLPATGAGALSMATAGSGEEDPVVSYELSRFFSNLLVDLQGAELAFQTMRISGGRYTAESGGLGPGLGPSRACVPAASSAGLGAGNRSSGNGGGASGSVGIRSPGRGSGDSGADGGEPVLELDLRATIRSFPPLNVRF